MSCPFREQGGQERTYESRVAVSSLLFPSWVSRVDGNSVYNLKRRIALLPPISIKIFETQVRASESGSEDERWDAHPKAQTHVLRSDELETRAPEEFASLSLVSSDGEEVFDPAQCLFCDLESPSLDENLRHMSDAHSFPIPSADRLTDASSFLQYLHTLISVFHECLFCHQERSMTSAVQNHMRGKGHCKLDLEDEESELWEFYDFQSDSEECEGEDTQVGERIVKLEDSLRLPSGKILGLRSQRRSSQRHFSKRRRSASPQQHLLTEAADETEPPVETMASKDQRLVMRKGAEMSLAGVSELQQRALMAVEKKMEGLQARVRNEYQAGVERGGNKQKTFRVKHMGKKRGGLEKRNG
jgi:pre-60S factor REI1